MSKSFFTNAATKSHIYGNNNTNSNINSNKSNVGNINTQRQQTQSLSQSQQRVQIVTNSGTVRTSGSSTAIRKLIYENATGNNAAVAASNGNSSTPKIARVAKVFSGTTKPFTRTSSSLAAASAAATAGEGTATRIGTATSLKTITTTATTTTGSSTAYQCGISTSKVTTNTATHLLDHEYGLTIDPPSMDIKPISFEQQQQQLQHHLQNSQQQQQQQQQHQQQTFTGRYTATVGNRNSSDATQPITNYYKQVKRRIGATTSTPESHPKKLAKQSHKYETTSTTNSSTTTYTYHHQQQQQQQQLKQDTNSRHSASSTDFATPIASPQPPPRPPSSASSTSSSAFGPYKFGATPSTTTSSSTYTSASKRNTESNRADTSLGILTKRFVDLLQESPDGVVDLNDASNRLSVQKRRIYDITNVLEGVGILEKKSKNNIQWKCGNATELAHREHAMTLESERLEQKENQLNSLIDQMRNELSSAMTNSSHYAYVTHSDLKGVDLFKDQTIIVIKAPAEAKLVLPDPEIPREIHVKAENNGEIKVFVCHDISPENSPTFGGTGTGTGNIVGNQNSNHHHHHLSYPHNHHRLQPAYPPHSNDPLFDNIDRLSPIQQHQQEFQMQRQQKMGLQYASSTRSMFAPTLPGRPVQRNLYHVIKDMGEQQHVADTSNYSCDEFYAKRSGDSGGGSGGNGSDDNSQQEQLQQQQHQTTADTSASNIVVGEYSRFPTLTRPVVLASTTQHLYGRTSSDNNVGNSEVLENVTHTNNDNTRNNNNNNNHSQTAENSSDSNNTLNSYNDSKHRKTGLKNDVTMLDCAIDQQKNGNRNGNEHTINSGSGVLTIDSMVVAGTSSSFYRNDNNTTQRQHIEKQTNTTNNKCNNTTNTTIINNGSSNNSNERLDSSDDSNQQQQHVADSIRNTLITDPVKLSPCTLLPNCNYFDEFPLFLPIEPPLDYDFALTESEGLIELFDRDFQ